VTFNGPDRSRRGRRKHKRHVVDFLHRKLRDALANLKNIHTPAPAGACVGCSDRNGEERQLHANQDQDECDRDNVPGAHDGLLAFAKAMNTSWRDRRCKSYSKIHGDVAVVEKIELLVETPTERFMPPFQ
jgi:hypothetical protein